MKKILTIGLSAFMLFACAACTGQGDQSSGNSTDSDSGSTPVAEQKELLFDNKFAGGIGISGLQSQTMSYASWHYGGSSGSPYWRLGQYCDLSTTRPGFDTSVHDMFPGDMFEPGRGISGQDGDYYTLKNQSGSKFMSVNPQVGEINLNIDSSKEYLNPETGAIQPRVNGEDWIHMILSQQAGVVYLDQVDELIMELDFTLTECEILDSSIGAAQFQWIFSVHDKASEGTMSAEYFWFNVTLFDNRYESFPGTQMFDGGKADATGKFIYAPTGVELFGEESGGKVETGVTYHVSLNLKDYMRNAFDIAKEKGALQNSRWEDMAVNGFNIGWEVSNVSKVGVKIANMSLKSKDKVAE